MPRFAANLSMLFTEHEFLDRFDAAAKVGFQAVEFLFPYDFAPEEVAKAKADAGVEIVLFNMPPGDWEAGERGLAAVPGRETDFAEALETAAGWAGMLESPRVHVMAGIPGEEAEAEAEAVYVANLKHAADRLGARHVSIEPINRRDIPGFFLNRQDEAHRIRAAVGAANVKVQMDLYHCQIVEGDVAMRLREWLPGGGVGHMQIAGVPERHEPAVGEMYYPYLFKLIDELGYEGWIGCEYRPRAGTVEGAGGAKAYGIGGTVYTPVGGGA
ncbi:MAG: TIM barrel protein, partial [Rhodospirillales bacterium]|nr:TIM barrel protein [Rhodospirillales bacterium]